MSQKILDEISQPLHVNDVVLTPGLSIGISFFPETTSDIESLIKAADQAMYQAKEVGGGFRFADKPANPQ